MKRTHTRQLATIERPPFASLHSGLLQRKCASGATLGSTGEREECRTKRNDGIQWMANDLGPHEAPPIVYEVLRSSGQPLDPVTRGFMEPRFGYDFSEVRVHTDAKAAESARAVNALAYTVGRDVVFDTGKYSPDSDQGRRLLAHELVHTLQQSQFATFASGQQLTLANPDDETEHEAKSVSQVVSPFGAINLGGAAHRRVSRQARPATVEEEADFQEASKQFFEKSGQVMQESILKQAGFQGPARATTTEDAVRVIAFWKLTIDQLVAQLPQLGASLQGRVSGKPVSTALDQQQASLIASLTPDGQTTYQEVIKQLKKEPFWKDYLDQTVVYIFPDLTGKNRYSGYTQRGTANVQGGRPTPAFIIHISKDALEAKDVAGSVAVLIHELSHTLYEPGVIKESLRPFLGSLSELLADHPKIVALRKGASDAHQARRTHMQLINQILFERTSYAEEEIFVHLQQLTSQPDVVVGGEKVKGSRYILFVVEGFVEQLMSIGLPPNMLRGILDSLSRRVALLYDRRIQSTPKDSKEQKLLKINKELALQTLSVARSEKGT